MNILIVIIRLIFDTTTIAAVTATKTVAAAVSLLSQNIVIQIDEPNYKKNPYMFVCLFFIYLRI